MNKEDAEEILEEMTEELAGTLLNEYQKFRLTGIRQSWNVIQNEMLIKEWEYNAQTGLVHDKIIDKIQNIIIVNYTKLYINTALMGHTQESPIEFAGRYIEDEDIEEDDLEYYGDYCETVDGDWRISDNCLDKMYNLCIKLLVEKDYSTKLYLIDTILNIVHQRSDLSSWFVEGGSETLSRIANG